MQSFAHCVCVCVCVCVWERERQGHITAHQLSNRSLCVRERERETGSHHISYLIVACVCVWEREIERERVTSQRSVQPVRNRLNPGLFANTNEHHCVCQATLFPFRAWTDAKTKDIINGLYFHFESWSSWLWKGELHFQLMLVVFGQSQCTGSVAQSEQTVLVWRRGFLENDSFERSRA